MSKSFQDLSPLAKILMDYLSSDQENDYNDDGQSEEDDIFVDNEDDDAVAVAAAAAAVDDDDDDDNDNDNDDDEIHFKGVGGRKREEKNAALSVKTKSSNKTTAAASSSSTTQSSSFSRNSQEVKQKVRTNLLGANLSGKDFIEQVKKLGKLNEINNLHESALSIAVKLNDEENIRYLIKNGANVEMELLNGDTVAHIAAMLPQEWFHSLFFLLSLLTPIQLVNVLNKVNQCNLKVRDILICTLRRYDHSREYFNDEYLWQQHPCVRRLDSFFENATRSLNNRRYAAASFPTATAAAAATVTTSSASFDSGSYQSNTNTSSPDSLSSIVDQFLIEQPTTYDNQQRNHFYSYQNVCPQLNNNLHYSPPALPPPPAAAAPFAAPPNHCGHGCTDGQCFQFPKYC